MSDVSQVMTNHEVLGLGKNVGIKKQPDYVVTLASLIDLWNNQVGRSYGANKAYNDMEVMEVFDLLLR